MGEDGSGSAKVEKWSSSGGTWSKGIQISPAPSEGSEVVLRDVSCTSTTACTAVGRYNVASGEDKTLVESWGGSEWQVQSSPNPEGFKQPVFAGVSCTSATACTAVGSAKKSANEAETVTLGARYE